LSQTHGESAQNYAHEPLMCRNAAGDEEYAIVEHQVSSDLAAAWGLFDRFEVGAALPGVWLSGPGLPNDATVECKGFDPEGVNTLTLADPRVFAKLLLTPWNQGFVASVRVATQVPLAQFNKDASRFAGERRFPSVTPAASVGYSAKGFKLGADLGITLREPMPVGDLTIGQEVNYGIGGEVMAVPDLLFIDLDIFGKAAPEALLGNTSEFPVEAAVAAKMYFGPVVVLAGVGTGLVPDYGAPDGRVFAGVGYYPLPDEEPPQDRDGDGILNDVDACPDAPEDKDGFRDQDGCPDVDNDKDGILDIDDECPDRPEDRDRWEDADGCPDPDNDKDRIEDNDDECPNDPEVYNGFEDEDGCPDSLPGDARQVKVRVRREQVEILDKVYFAFDSDRILPKSYGLLDDVAEVIMTHQEIPRIRVEGHTDSDGSDRYNLQLSDRRAKSVLRYLVAAGVEASRLVAKGYGETRPLESNRTESGKARNRRVEFTIVDDSTEGDADASDRPVLLTTPDDESEDQTDDESTVSDEDDEEEEEGEDKDEAAPPPASRRPVQSKPVEDDDELFADDWE
ncbi:MAG: OmpA family protein, partial [Myxococcota bacterium]